jgi:hypothetical protein
LLYHALEELGFKKIEQIAWENNWLPPYYNANYRPPQLGDEERAEIRRAWTLQAELSEGSVHRAIIA